MNSKSVTDWKMFEEPQTMAKVIKEIKIGGLEKVTFRLVQQRVTARRKGKPKNYISVHFAVTMYLHVHVSHNNTIVTQTFSSRY